MLTTLVFVVPFLHPTLRNLVEKYYTENFAARFNLIVEVSKGDVDKSIQFGKKFGALIKYAVRKNKRTKASFAKEWSVYNYDKDNTWDADDEGMVERFLKETAETRLSLKDKIIFDAGCGNGKLESLIASNCRSIIAMDFDVQSPRSVFAPLFHSALKESLSSYSVWTTQGSELVEPCLFYCAGLPSLQNLAAMLDGQWLARGWNQPCRLTAV